jgi:hypothetical protein
MVEEGSQGFEPWQDIRSGTASLMVVHSDNDKIMLLHDVI